MLHALRTLREQDFYGIRILLIETHVPSKDYPWILDYINKYMKSDHTDKWELVPKQCYNTDFQPWYTDIHMLEIYKAYIYGSKGTV